MKEIAEDNEILRVVNGSKLYGTHHEDSDNDAIAVFVEPPEYVFSKRKIETALLHSRHPQGKAGPGDIDGQAYSVRHFISLVLEGNPALLTILFAPEQYWLNSTPEGAMLMANAESFVSMKAAPRFRGYIQNQLGRLKGVKTGHVPNRPELVEKYGYDVKYATAVARLAIQGVEYFYDGVIESPMDAGQINFLKSIRNGSWTYAEVIGIIEGLELDLENAISKSLLPLEPKYDIIYDMSRDLHESYWERSRNENLVYSEPS